MNLGWLNREMDRQRISLKTWVLPKVQGRYVSVNKYNLMFSNALAIRTQKCGTETGAIKGSFSPRYGK